MKTPFLLTIVVLFTLGVYAQTSSKPQSRSRTRSSFNKASQSAPPVATSRTPARSGLDQSLPIRRVILYSNGVAYIERRGTVTGHAEINLSFKQSQVDDVLKSMVVLDLGQGRIGAVSYNSSAPPSARLADIPFSIEADTDDSKSGGLAGVLSQLQGAHVIVATANRTATGSILTVEERKAQIDANKPASVTHALVVASESGELISFDLAEVRSVKLIDEGSRRDVSEFANASASARRRDAKTIVVTSDGAGSREMLVSYTVAAPIWKTTYRVVLDQAGKPFFQGWAIVDNVSDEDWNNISLALVSGTPVSFIQPIQKPFYRYRPVVPMPSDLKLEPQVYEPSDAPGAGGGMGAGANSSLKGLRDVGSNNATIVTLGNEFQQKQILNLPSNGRASNYAAEYGINSNASLAPPPARVSLSDAMTQPDSGVEAAATGSEVGDLFEYKIDQPVTVLRDRSALIPILQTRMDGERVSIYNEAVRRDRPMGGMLLKNTSTLTLEDGAMTIIDGDAYAGEALMERLKPAEQRLISFALDLGTIVNIRVKDDRAPTFLVRAVNGVFEAHYYQTSQKTYTLTNQTDKPRVVYIEHPVRQDWALSDDTQKPTATTARYYRFRIPLDPHQKVELPVTERRALMDRYVISDFTRPQLELFVANKYIDAQTQAALEKIIDIKSRIAMNEARQQTINQEATEIGQDQQRLRENIKALTATAEARQLIARYVAKADTQESRLEQLEKDRRAAVDERARLQAELEAAIRGLAFDRKLN
jgi:hypothetical protein